MGRIGGMRRTAAVVAWAMLAAAAVGACGGGGSSADADGDREKPSAEAGGGAASGPGAEDGGGEDGGGSGSGSGPAGGGSRGGSGSGSAGGGSGSGSGGGGSGSGGSGGTATTEPEFPELEMQARLSKACVKPGQTQTIRVETDPNTDVNFTSQYSDGNSEMASGNAFYGGAATGKTDANGVWEHTWTVNPAAPPGRVDVLAGAGNARGFGRVDLHYRLAAATETC